MNYPCPVCDSPLDADTAFELCKHCGWDEYKHEVRPRLGSVA